ncbi:MAG: hypothetical protein WC415_00595 [Patescibacteria group bacterium]|jgi:hypothetical protein
MIYVNKFRIIWIIALTAMVFVLAWLKIVPTGKITYFNNSDFISNLTPVERMNVDKIIGDPVYFTLRVPRRFESAKLTIKFKNESALPIIEAGVLIDKKVWNYDLKPLDNSILDNLIGKWNSVRSGDLLLLQREKKFKSVEEFLKNPPVSDKIAAYNYSLEQNFLLPDYKTSKEEMTLCRPLQGAYQFYTYIKDEDLSFDFALQDLNKNDDEDIVDALVYYKDQEIYKETLPDNNSNSRNLKLFLTNLPEGVYKISLRANNDIVTRTITTSQSKITFINKVALADTPEVSCGRNLFTNSRVAQFQTILSNKLGQIKITQAIKSPLERGVHQYSEAGCVGVCTQQEVNLNETYKLFSTGCQNRAVPCSYETLPSFSEIIMPSDGITVTGDGLFSFSLEQFFNPEIKKVDENFDPDREDVDFIIAKYTPPTLDGEWKIATADFDLTNAYKEFNKHSFLISIPGLRAEDGTLDGVEVGEVKIELSGVSLFDKIFKMINDK